MTSYRRALTSGPATSSTCTAESFLKVWGRILSVYEASDEVGRSCQGLFAKSAATGERSEIRINLGEEHGAFFRPHDEWLTPVIEWVHLNPATGASRGFR
jgi:hypothetical protein